MRCETVREALSARIDGEQEPIPGEVVDRHMESCPPCRSWFSSAEDLRRTMILQPAPEIPDLAGPIMRRLPESRRAPHLIRVALALVALAQTAMALTQFFDMDMGMGGSGAFPMGHMNHESAVWNLAVGIGLGWAAVRTRTAAGQLPMLTVFAGTLTAVSLLDALHGQVTAARLATHIPVLLGVALLYLVYRAHRDDDRPHRADALPRTESGPAVFDEHADMPESQHNSERTQRPASRHRAA